MKIAVLQHIASADQRGHILGVQDVSFHRVIGTFRIYRNSIQRPALIEREFFNFSNAGRNMHSRNAQIGIEGLLSDFRYRLAAQHRRDMHLRAFALIAGDGRAGIVRGKGKVLFPQRRDVLLRREHLAASGAIAAFGLAWLGVGGFHRRLSHDGMHVMLPLHAVLLRPSAGVGGGGAADQRRRGKSTRANGSYVIGKQNGRQSVAAAKHIVCNHRHLVGNLDICQADAFQEQPFFQPFQSLRERHTGQVIAFLESICANDLHTVRKSHRSDFRQALKALLRDGK